MCGESESICATLMARITMRGRPGGTGPGFCAMRSSRRPRVLKRVENVKDIIIGQHGLWITRGFRRGVLLPQVAYERGWTREEFLSQTCRKAGLPLDAWKDHTSQIHSFEAEVFGEKE